jgi:hypothetical protein
MNEDKNEYRREYSEQYCFYLISDSLYYPLIPVFVHRDELPSKRGFSSLYAVSQEGREAIERAGTVRGYKGPVWSPTLSLDFDTYEAGYRAEEKIKELGYDYTLYDTGGRGVHINILCSIGPSHILPGLHRQYVESHFPEADKSIYSHLHLFRLPGTQHERTGKTKQTVSRQPGISLRLSKLSVKEPVLEHKTLGSIFENFQVMQLSHPVVVGHRHATLVKLCYALKAHGLGKDLAEWWARECNSGYSNPKSPEDVSKIVRSIYE